MAATQGTAIFYGTRSQRSYIVDVYLSDTVNTPVNWSAGGAALATTPETWTPPEDVVLNDISVVTGATQTRLQVLRDQSPIEGGVLAHALHLNTLAKRPVLNIGFRAHSTIALIQLA